MQPLVGFIRLRADKQDDLSFDLDTAARFFETSTLMKTMIRLFLAFFCLSGAQLKVQAVDHHRAEGIPTARRP